MGCSNSKSTTTTALDEGNASASASASALASAPVTKASKMETASDKQEYPASETFTIPLDTFESNGRLNETVRQPPKRIQELVKQAASTEPLTLEELEDKQQRAEQRRQELLQQKVENIQKNMQMLLRPIGEEQDQPQHLQEGDEAFK